MTIGHTTKDLKDTINTVEVGQLKIGSTQVTFFLRPGFEYADNVKMPLHKDGSIKQGFITPYTFVHQEETADAANMIYYNVKSIHGIVIPAMRNKMALKVGDILKIYKAPADTNESGTRKRQKTAAK
jgi:hypothetical protein